MNEDKMREILEKRLTFEVKESEASPGLYIIHFDDGTNRYATPEDLEVWEKHIALGYCALELQERLDELKQIINNFPLQFIQPTFGPGNKPGYCYFSPVFNKKSEIFEDQLTALMAGAKHFLENKVVVAITAKECTKLPYDIDGLN